MRTAEFSHHETAMLFVSVRNELERFGLQSPNYN